MCWGFVKLRGVGVVRGLSASVILGLGRRGAGGGLALLSPRGLRPRGKFPRGGLLQKKFAINLFRTILRIAVRSQRMLNIYYVTSGWRLYVFHIEVNSVVHRSASEGW